MIEKRSLFPSLFECLKSLTFKFGNSLHGNSCFLVKGLFIPQDSNISTSLFQYIFTNPKRYNFSALSDVDQRLGCFITSKHPAFTEKETLLEDSSFLFTIILYSSRNEPTKEVTPGLKYYLLITSPSSPLDIQDSSSEYITEGYYLRDIKNNAEKRMMALLDQVAFWISCLGCEILWKRFIMETTKGRTSPFRKQ